MVESEKFKILRFSGNKSLDKIQGDRKQSRKNDEFYSLNNSSGLFLI